MPSRYHGVRYREVEAETVPRRCLGTLAAILIASLFVGIPVYVVLEKFKDDRKQILECPPLKHKHLEYRSSEDNGKDCKDAVSAKLKGGKKLKDFLNAVGVLRGTVEDGGELARTLDEAPFKGRKIPLGNELKYW